MPAVRTARVRFLFHCWLLLIAAAALCNEAAAQGSACGKLDPGQVDPIPDANFRSETTVNLLTLDWLPPDYDSQYHYIVNCPTCPTKQANTTDETYTFLDLTAVTEYNFTIQAGLLNCTLSTPFYLSGKTFLSSIPGSVHISLATHTSFRTHWAASPDAGVQYEVNGALTVQNTSYVFIGQESGAKIEVFVRPVKTGFEKGNTIFGTGYTKLFAIDVNSVKISASETAISVSWRPSITSGVFYQLICRRVGSGDVTNVNSSVSSATCSSLQSGEAYRLSVAVKKEGGFDDAVTQLPNQLTKLFPIDASSVQVIVNETAISVSWHPTNTRGVSYQLTCRRVGSGDVTNVTSSIPSLTCGSLESGQTYVLTVSVKKKGGFDDVATQLFNQPTKLFAIDASSAQMNASETAISVSWRASSTAGVSYLLTCRRVSSGDVTTVTSSSPSATCSSLQTGQVYNLSIVVRKAGGFDDVVTQLHTQRTRDGEAGTVSELRLLSVPGGAVRLSWKPLSPAFGQGVVFEYALRLDGPCGCAAAFQLNCSDCGRHRQQLQSDEARQRLENVTRNCAAPVSVQAFSFYDTELVLEVPVSSAGGSTNSLQPWTAYSALLWPVNLAGPGAVRSVSFRSPETPSGAVRSLRATPSEAEALVEFEEPELANGLLQAFAVQVLTASSVCSQLLVLNPTNVSCQLPNCETAGILLRLSQECSSTQHVSSGGNGSSITVKVQQLQPGTEYLVRVTPVSQTLPGAAAELNFVTVDGDGGGNTVAIVVSTVVSVLAVLAIGAAVLVFVRHRQQNSAPQQTAPVSSDAHNLASGVFSEYATVNEPAAKPTDYVEIVPGATQQTAPASSAADNLANDVFSEYATVDVDTPTNYAEIVPVKGQVRYKS